MNAFTPKAVMDDIIATYDCMSPPSLLREVVEHHLQSLGISEMDSFEKSELLTEPVRTEIQKYLVACKQLSYFPVCELVGWQEEIIIGSAYPRPDDTQERKTVRSAICLQDTIHLTLCNLPPHTFEQFCAQYLMFLGAWQTKVTPRTNDGGFDVLAKFPLIHTQLVYHEFFYPLRLHTKALGQAKCYPPNKPVGVDEVRELAGSFLIRLYTDIIGGKPNSSIEELFGTIRLCDPLLCLFLTTSYFSPQATALAKQCGILPFNGKQIAAHLASGRVGILSKEGIDKFCLDSFNQWIFQPQISK